MVYTVCSRSGLSLADAADCFQQTWVTLHRKRKAIHDPTRLSAWLVTTAKREVLRILRMGEKLETGDSLDRMVAHDPLPDEVMEQLERQACLEVSISQLDPRCRDVIDLFFFEPDNQSYEQIAKSLGIPSNSLGPIRRRCLERLRQILEKNGFPGVRNDDPETL